MSIAKFDNEDFQAKAPELLADLAKHTELTAIELGIDKEQAENLGMLVSIKISENWQGINLYIPKGVQLFACARDKQIYNEFNGVNHAHLAKKFNLSMQWIYKIVKRVQKEELNKRQIKMFDE